MTRKPKIAVKSAPAKKIAVKSAPAKKIAVKPAPAKKIAVKSAPAKKIAVKSATRVTKIQGDASMVPEMHPRHVDTKYTGPEPKITIQPDEADRKVLLMSGFTWYNHYYSYKEAQAFYVQYLTIHGRQKEAKIIAAAPKECGCRTVSWLARLSLRGLELNEHENSTLENEIARMIKQVANPEIQTVSQTGGAKVVKTAQVSQRPNIQEIMRDKARDAAGELEGIFDDFLKAGAKTTFKVNVLNELAKQKVMTQHVGLITDVWKKKQAEFTEVIKGKDAQLVQGYQHYTKVQLKNILKFVEQVLSDLNSYVSVKKAAKGTRKHKVIPVEKLVAKMKFMKAFKDLPNKLDLVGLHPVKLHGASEAWVYDTAKRKLHHFIADEYSKTFSVKGNVLLGFDSKQSEVKTLRKPAEQLAEIMGSKPVARKYFKDIRAVSTTPKGRFSATMVILKAF